MLATFYLQVTPMLPTKFHVHWPLIEFQDGGHGGHDGHFVFRIGTILVIFALQDTPMHLTKFHVSRSFLSEEEAKNRFSR